MVISCFSTGLCEQGRLSFQASPYKHVDSWRIVIHLPLGDALLVLYNLPLGIGGLVHCYLTEEDLYVFAAAPAVELTVKHAVYLNACMSAMTRTFDSSWLWIRKLIKYGRRWCCNELWYMHLIMKYDMKFDIDVSNCPNHLLVVTKLLYTNNLN